MSFNPQHSDFPLPLREEWLERAFDTAKGGTWEALKFGTADGIAVEPLYAPGSGEAMDLRPGGEPWAVIQRADHPEPAQARSVALEDIDNGAKGVALTFKGALCARGFGLKAADSRCIGLALKDLPLHVMHVRLEAGERGAAAAEALVKVINARSLNPERMVVSFGMDPIGALAAQGGLNDGWEDVGARVRDVSKMLSRDFTGPFVEADGRVYHDGGASEAQELGCAVASVAAYLRLLEAQLDDARAARAVGMTLAADADMFTSLAKFRAARLLWRQLMAACGLADEPLKLHAETSFRMMTSEDPHGNLLRNTAAVFAAGLGGANSICALPFSLAMGLPDRFARRMARNTQSILIHEANLHRVSDAAAGSGYVHNLTQSLAEKAWQYFQEIERHGGMLAALRSGFVQDSVRNARERRLGSIKAGKTTIIGVTAYKFSNGEAASVLPVAREAFGPVNRALAIAAKRDAEDFETRTAN